MEEQGANIKQVRDFFELSTTDFMDEWKELSPEDKIELKALVGAEEVKE